jgi:hypothetical protein
MAAVAQTEEPSVVQAVPSGRRDYRSWAYSIGQAAPPDAIRELFDVASLAMGARALEDRHVEAPTVADFEYVADIAGLVAIRTSEAELMRLSVATDPRARAFALRALATMTSVTGLIEWRDHERRASLMPRIASRCAEGLGDAYELAFSEAVECLAGMAEEARLAAHLPRETNGTRSWIVSRALELVTSGRAERARIQAAR